VAVGVRLSEALDPLGPPGRAWTALAALLGAGALCAWALPAGLLDWQPARAAREPWRLFSAAFVHWSALHLGANLLGCLLVGALGRAAALPAAAALAWLAAWPLTHLALLAQPALAHYGGLSGVLHAGVAVAALWLLVHHRGRPRAVGAALLAGLALKVVLEDPLGAPLARPAGWDIAIAPLAHASGALAGALIGGAAAACARPRPFSR
jgi:rhomboid family GlyGly-CTERM serine protease